jgi:hypothetical protein
LRDLSGFATSGLSCDYAKQILSDHFYDLIFEFIDRQLLPLILNFIFGLFFDLQVWKIGELLIFFLW